MELMVEGIRASQNNEIKVSDLEHIAQPDPLKFTL